MSLLSLIQIGGSGLNVASQGLNVVGHNVTNASSIGYTRQRMSTANAAPISQMGLWIGQGVDINGLSRVTDVFVNERFVAAHSDFAHAEASLHAHQIIEAAFSTSGGSAGALSAFFDSLGELASDPSQGGYRMAVMSSAENFAASITSTNSQMQEVQDAISSEISGSMSGINDALDRIAELNGLIGQGGSPDLMDERDRLVGEVAQSIGATVDYDTSGGATLFVGGHAVVMGDTARHLSYTEGSDGRPVINISADDAYIEVTAQLGGSIGGTLSAWDTAQDVIDELDEFVVSFVDAFNAQHGAGFDANGNPGGDFFTYDPADPSSSLQVAQEIVDDPDLIAAAADPSANAGDSGNLDALLALQDAEIVDGDTPGGFIASIYTMVGSAVASAELEYDVTASAKTDAEQLRASVSGVNLDEEAADLLQWQSAYQAAARVISTTDQLLGELMEMAR